MQVSTDLVTISVSLNNMQSVKKYIGYFVIILTLVAFGLYLKYNPAVIEQLKTTKISTIVIVLSMYSFMTYILIRVSKVVLRLSDKELTGKENALLTMYSSVVNFFGPLQSGPGFRIVYLKKKHDIKIKKYINANIVYYLIFTAISGLFLINGLLGIFVTLSLGVFCLILAIIFPSIVRAIPLIGTNKYILGFCDLAEKFRLDVIKLTLLTFSQLLVVSGIYFVELRSIDSTVNFWQALIYGGAANFSLFVSLTPGGLGFRESFLFFSQRLHQINSDTIVAASVLDRALFVLFLALMMLIILMMHGKQLLSVGRAKSSQKSRQ
jgi:uncharacterized membrane protein YbhN (UPF0104 family)